MRESWRPRRAGEPSSLLIVIAAISVALPYLGLSLIAWGGYRLSSGGDDGWLLVASGVALIILDILIDVVWAIPALSVTDEPHLNRPAQGLVGRRAIVTETIRDGRGKVAIDHTHWIAEGPETAVGTTVRIVAARDVVLVVEPE
jgi:membrane protein implicated in regulation of membrane protease activity